MDTPRTSSLPWVMASPMADDAETHALVVAATAGDREAFGQLFDRHANHVFAVALAIVRDEQAAGDVTQDAFVKALLALPRFRRHARFRTWLTRIAQRTAIDHLRRHAARRIDAGAADAFADTRHPDACRPDRTFERREAARRVRAALRDLTPRLRLPLLLRFYAGWSYDRIAEGLGISMGTVASRLSRGQARLAARLADGKEEGR